MDEPRFNVGDKFKEKPDDEFEDYVLEMEIICMASQRQSNKTWVYFVKSTLSDGTIIHEVLPEYYILENFERMV
jgi:hypothetical protein